MFSRSLLSISSTVFLNFAGKLNPSSSSPGVRSSHCWTHLRKRELFIIFYGGMRV